MDNIPPFARKYVSKAYFDRLDWRERAAYLKGVQDVMDLFSKDLENRAMGVLKRKAHWLEPIESTSSSSSSRPTLSQPYSSLAAPKAFPTITTAAAALATAKATAAVTTLNNARVVPKTGQSTQQSSQSSSQSSSQPSSQPFNGSQSTASQPSQNASQSLSSQSSTTSQPHLKRKTTENAPLDTEITFVGMRYRSGHVFSPTDQVRLERDRNNPVDKNAIKVMVAKNGKWFHAAYVGRDEANALKDQLGIEHMKLTYLRAYLASVKYRLQA
ncbi:hypothetical protein KI688_002445 [Linnemannia hyalina]|uniref:HIRAN domain-containing protein n=1 Tax=Linnemannia hyalina TaxID=64524 RepID=A0A9P8BRC9_9FUNG|nr:hypothetical protein KI688_002445 [Linnemannia hyalina]